MKDSKDLVLTAKIGSQHGLDGTLKAFFFRGNSRHIKRGDVLTVILSSSVETHLEVEYIKDVKESDVDKSLTYIKFKDYDDRDASKELVNAKIYIKKQDAISLLKKDEILTSDLVGLKIKNTECVVSSVIDKDGILYLEIINNKNSFLVPYTSHFFGDVDLEKKQIEILNIDIIK